MAEARGFSLLERFELKYHIPVAWADRIGEFIAPYCEEDHYSQITPGHFYWITNLYLDSDRWTFLGWKKARLLDRFNMRIRTYGEHPAQDGTFHFESKRKVKEVCYKSRALHNAHPRLLTQYKRRAWFGLREEYSRVTIDTGMRFREENGFDYTVDPHYMHSTGIPRFFKPGCDAVLELKCPCSQVPFWMIDLIRFLNLRQGGFSKFGNAAAEWSRVYEHPKDFKDPYWTRLAGNF